MSMAGRTNITWLHDLEINPLNPTTGDAAIVIGGTGLGGSDGGGVPQDTWIESVEIGGGNVANCDIALYNSAGTQIVGCDIISSIMSVATFPGAQQPRRAVIFRLARQMVGQIFKAHRLGRREYRRDADLLSTDASASLASQIDG